MFRALYTAASGMNAQQLNLDNVANNLANTSTAGFRRRRVQFTDLLYQNMVMPGSASTQQTTNAAGLQVGLGTKPGASEVLQLQGDFSQTGNPLDLAIQGQGFFQVRMPDGQIAYTRAGTFHLDSQGNIVTADGNPLEPAITLPPDALSVTIGADGTVSVTQPGQTQATQVGNIHLALFPNPGGLNSIGNNLMLATTASGDPIVGTPGGTEGVGSLQQGFLEQSNVDVVQEFVYFRWESPCELQPCLKSTAMIHSKASRFAVDVIVECNCSIACHKVNQKRGPPYESQSNRSVC